METCQTKAAVIDQACRRSHFTAVVLGLYMTSVLRTKAAFLHKQVDKMKNVQTLPNIGLHLTLGIRTVLSVGGVSKLVLILETDRRPAQSR